MKTSSFLLRSVVLCGVLALPAIAQAGVSLDINVPGVSLHLGDQDNRGYYWDGYDWRPPQWWHEHKNKHGPQHDNGPRGHDNRGHDDRGGNGDHGRGNPGNHGNGNNGNNGNHGDDRHGGNGQPVPPQGNGPHH
ncbi:DUF2502 domain-containing protein [Chimaeribacter coloradensis]|uniref:DUF2502 domain-containing protein n=1 Tax=Chimaeribacter coloradensis TaxID=2060068 RepID=A0A2N5EDA4_9GAMM|nr:DUF2502 domain-containing protein [Chimaeribacter coloradensis]PLR40525.1 DUF2502 domain-containing protein [Chimaeribacter coloradensis]